VANNNRDEDSHEPDEIVMALAIVLSFRAFAWSSFVFMFHQVGQASYIDRFFFYSFCPLASWPEHFCIFVRFFLVEVVAVGSRPYN
jgi:hypothetical protein